MFFDCLLTLFCKVHWDHVGEPRDFPRSTFVVGYGALGVLSGKAAGLRGGHSFFEADLLDPRRTIELLDPSIGEVGSGDAESPASHRLTRPASPSVGFSGPWQPSSEELPPVLDVFRDGSLYVVDAPGHLPGHINLLARVADEHVGSRWVYLAGDACHDRRIMRREKEIGEWHDAHGQVCCIHADRATAEETIERIRGLERKGVEVIFAHDVEWEDDVRNRMRFFGATR